MATPDPSSIRDVADEEKLLSLIVSEIETNAPTICQTVEMGEHFEEFHSIIGLDDVHRKNA